MYNEKTKKMRYVPVSYTHLEDYESGDKEYDYALCNVDTERTILDWD